jgi:hypothetical protein
MGRTDPFPIGPLTGSGRSDNHLSSLRLLHSDLADLAGPATERPRLRRGLGIIDCGPNGEEGPKPPKTGCPKGHERRRVMTLRDQPSGAKSV